MNLRQIVLNSVRAVRGLGAASGGVSGQRPHIPVAEPLETRQLLSSTLSDGVLTITGTSDSDEIIIRRDRRRSSKLQIIDNGQSRKINTSSVQRILVWLGSGSDTLRADERYRTMWIPMYVSGGRGSDTIIGGSGGDVLRGEIGLDQVTGGRGNDSLDGNGGNDTVHGGDGRDLIIAGAGNDLLNGDNDHDLIYGDEGDDTLNGGDGNDTLGGDGEDRFWFVGGTNPAITPGNDVLNGGDGDDYLVGGPESTTIHHQPNGRDTLTGGAGHDVLDARQDENSSTDDVDVITDREDGDSKPMENHTRPLRPGETEYPLGMHLHAYITIIINDNGVERTVRIPYGIGDFAGRPSVHTHESHVNTGEFDGTIHFHDVDEREFTLGEFFENWGITFDANHIGRYVAGNGRTVTMTVNGVNNTEFGNYVIQSPDFREDPDGEWDNIVIRYQ